MIGEAQVSFHFMRSRFMERHKKDLKNLANLFKNWISILKPIYVSDHLAKFSINGRSLFFLGELDYRKDYNRVKQKIIEWEELLDSKIFFENFPSFIDYDTKQIDFLDRLTQETGCGILFDLSNAVIASKNSSYPLSNWMKIACLSEHFHIAGMRLSDTTPTLWMDSHDCEISNESLAFFKKILENPQGISFKTIVVERDNQIEKNSWLLDVKKVKNLISA